MRVLLELDCAVASVTSCFTGCDDIDSMWPGTGVAAPVLTFLVAG